MASLSLPSSAWRRFLTTIVTIFLISITSVHAKARSGLTTLPHPKRLAQTRRQDLPRILLPRLHHRVTLARRSTAPIVSSPARERRVRRAWVAGATTAALARLRSRTACSSASPPRVSRSTTQPIHGAPSRRARSTSGAGASSGTAPCETCGCRRARPSSSETLTSPRSARGSPGMPPPDIASPGYRLSRVACTRAML